MQIRSPLGKSTSNDIPWNKKSSNHIQQNDLLKNVFTKCNLKAGWSMIWPNFLRFPEQILWNPLTFWGLFNNFTVELVTVNATTVYFSLFLGLIIYKKDNICVCYHYDAVIIFWQILWINVFLVVKLTKQHSIFNCEVKTWVKKIGPNSW